MNGQAAEDDPLILLVGHAEAPAQPGGLGVLAQDAQAQGVQRPPRHFLRASPERAPQAHRDLLGRLVREGHGADPARVNPAGRDQMVDPADQAEGLPRPGPGHHQQGPERRLDGQALLRERVQVHRLQRVSRSSHSMKPT